ncbi:hypothetical protein ACWD4G_20340 [Streptomyces sp. NPDC002643]
MEWTDPRYASAIDLLMTMRATAPQEPKAMCRRCRGFRFHLFIAPGGERHWNPCAVCGETGRHPVRPRRPRR